MATQTFPIDLGALKPLKLDPRVTELTAEQKATLKHNIQLCRDAIVFFTGLAGARGLSGHTGGARDPPTHRPGDLRHRRAELRELLLPLRASHLREEVQPFLEARGHLIAAEAALRKREGRHALREARIALLGLLQLPLQLRLLVSELHGRTPSWVHC